MAGSRWPDNVQLALMSAEEVAQISVPFAEAPEKLKPLLAEHGVAIVTDLLSPDECQGLQRLLGQDLREALDLESIEGQQHEPAVQEVIQMVKSADDLELPRVWPHGTGLGGALVTRCGLAHGRFAWAARLNPRVRGLYGHLHGCNPEDLVTGVDVLFYTPGTAWPSEVTTELTAHADQNLADPELGEREVYQSALYIWDSHEEGASTTIAWPRSHRETFQALMSDPSIRRVGKRGGHYSEIRGMKDLQARHEILEEFLANARRVPVPAGGLLVWASRTIHQGHQGGRRLAMPICWEPRERRGPSSLRRKLRLIFSGHPSTHWASRVEQHGCSTNVPYAMGLRTRPWHEWHQVQLPTKATILPAPIQPDLLEKAKSLCKTVLDDSSNYYESVERDEELCSELMKLLTPECQGAL